MTKYDTPGLYEFDGHIKYINDTLDTYIDIDIMNAFGFCFSNNAKIRERYLSENSCFRFNFSLNYGGVWTSCEFSCEL